MTARTLKMIGAGLLALLVALAAGWIWGSVGGRAAERELDGLRLQLMLSHARTGILNGRVELYRLNFGAAAKSLEGAKAVLSGAVDAFEAQGDAARAAAARRALQAAEEARHLAAQVDQTAQGAAERALTELQQTDPPPGRLVVVESQP